MERLRSSDKREVQSPVGEQGKASHKRHRVELSHGLLTSEHTWKQLPTNDIPLEVPQTQHFNSRCF